MTNVITIEKAKKELPKLVKEVETSRKRYFLSGEGKPQAVVLGFEDFLRSVLRAKRSKALKKIQESARAKGLDKLTMKEIEAEIKDYRKTKK